MSPERRFGVTLFLSLALWFPTLQELLADNVALSTALTRYALGLAAAWVGVAVVDRLLSGYRDANLAKTRVSFLRRASDVLSEQRPADAEPRDPDGG
ncbi:MAG TPA: hypothetical protein VFC99_17635 [Acidimicrobiia bacterium]|nr:hypothetical protein [Acidimicrobiia bacterium]